LVSKHVAAARVNCSSLVKKRVTPHVLRHYADARTMPTGAKAKPLDEPPNGGFSFGVSLTRGIVLLDYRPLRKASSRSPGLKSRGR
jgi:hypothetical protein